MLFFVKQKTAYEMRISDWSSDVCSSDLRGVLRPHLGRHRELQHPRHLLRVAHLRERVEVAQLLLRRAAAAEALDDRVDLGRPGHRGRGAHDHRTHVSLDRRQVAPGSAPCRQRVCSYLQLSVVPVHYKQTNHYTRIKQDIAESCYKIYEPD